MFLHKKIHLFSNTIKPSGATIRQLRFSLQGYEKVIDYRR